MQTGILLQHFGTGANRDSVIRTAPELEELGYASVWVRDHLMFEPHGFERRSTTFMEPFTTLAAIGAITERLRLGTAVTIPFRHPLVTSQLYGGVASAAGADRIIAGIGAGTPRKPFDATGNDYATRTRAVRELAETLRLTWSGRTASYHGELFSFDDVLLDPRPAPDTPIWYGGSSPAAVRRALAYCDGWLAGKCPLRTLDMLTGRLRAGAAEAGRAMTVAVSPVLSVAGSREEALHHIDVAGLLAEARSHKYWVGPFDGVDDLAGLVVAGTVDDCAEQLDQIARRGVDHVIVDLRFRPGEYLEQARLVAREVLPALATRASARV